MIWFLLSSGKFQRRNDFTLLIFNNFICCSRLKGCFIIKICMYISWPCQNINLLPSVTIIIMICFYEHLTNFIVHCQEMKMTRSHFSMPLRARSWVCKKIWPTQHSAGIEISHRSIGELIKSCQYNNDIPFHNEREIICI